MHRGAGFHAASGAEAADRAWFDVVAALCHGPGAVRRVRYRSREPGKAEAVPAELQPVDPGQAEVLCASCRVHSEPAFQAIETPARAALVSGQSHGAPAGRFVDRARLEEAVAESRGASPSTRGLPGWRLSADSQDERLSDARGGLSQ